MVGWVSDPAYNWVAAISSVGVEGHGCDRLKWSVNWSIGKTKSWSPPMSTHQQLLYHIIFSTKNRYRWLTDGFRESVFAYMAGTAKELNGFAIKVGGFYDHAHLLVRIPAKIAVADFVGKLKSSTSKHINESSGLIKKFGWQDGYGAFSVSVSAKDAVIAYIEKQMEHHKAQSFEDEYLAMLAKHEVEYDEKYVFD